MLKDALLALRHAERPVLIYGAGVRLAGAVDEARELAHRTGVPVAVTWAARDMFPQASEKVLCVGGFGTHGTRAANFAMQNADWILSVGSRLDSKATGTPREYFARAADIYMVDIDPAEIAKFGGRLGRRFQGAQADARLFLHDACALVCPPLGYRQQFAPWRGRCQDWLRRYPACSPEYEQEEGVNPYALVKKLSELLQPGEVIVSDTGLSLGWMMQGFEFKEGQRFVHAWNQTPMGYGLPAAIGAAFARSGQRVVLVTGDGGFMLNIQELALLAKHKLPVKIVLFNNQGHAMCRQTQEQWLGGKYYSTGLDDLAMPDFGNVARSFGLNAWAWATNAGLERELSVLLNGSHPALLDVRISPDARLIPQVAYGSPNEDGGPKLPREELRENMIVGCVS